MVSPGGWLRAFVGTSDMGTMVAEYDWSATPLGPPAEWSAELRAVVRMCLSTRFPVLVVVGPEMIKIYNDGYRTMLGSEKHPRALGAPAKEIWSEIWDVVGPLFDRVYETGEATWSEDQLLVIERNGYPEDCYFTFSYSPVIDDDGTVTGVVDIATETTEAVTTHERLSCLADLTSTLVEADSVTDVCLQATRVLSRWPAAVRAVDVHLGVDGRLILVASNRRRNHTEIDPAVGDGRSVLDALAEQGPVDRPVDEVVVPLGGSPDGAVGAMALALNPQRPFDAGYFEFVALIARAVGAALDRAYRHALEVDEYRHIGETLQRAMLQPASDFTTVTARYLPATGNLAVGGDWYDVIELSGERRAIVVGDCVGHGLDAAAAMSQLRSAARAMLLQGSGPAATLNGLDLFARSIDDAFCTTAVCMVVDRAEHTITYARAGHPYPLVSTAEGPEWLDGGAGPPLGFLPSPQHTSTVYHYTPGDVLVVCSDGLIERRGEDIDAGFERLARHVARFQEQTVQDIADELIAELLPETPADDVVLVVKRLTGR